MTTSHCRPSRGVIRRSPSANEGVRAFRDDVSGDLSAIVDGVMWKPIDGCCDGVNVIVEHLAPARNVEDAVPARWRSTRSK